MESTKWYLQSQVAEIAAKAKVGVDIKDRKSKTKTYKQCFIGREMCKWFIVNGVSNYATSESNNIFF
jgi:hypothetical protein